MDIKVEHLNQAYVRIICDRSIAKDLSDYFMFRPDGYQFTPAFRNKWWDGYIRLFDVNKAILYRGLLDYVNTFAKANNYSLDVDKRIVSDRIKISKKDVADFTTELNPHTCREGKWIKITPRADQITAITNCIQKKRCLLLSPTGSGKSLIIYATMRWVQENQLAPGNKIAVVVPNVGLVKQMLADFAEYSYFDDSWDIEQNCHLIYSGKEKTTDKQIIVTTWQSIYKLPKKWFDNIGMVVVDEAHGAQADSLKGILEKCTNTDFRIGTTGTIKECKVHRLVLEGLIGPVFKPTTTHQLIKDKKLANVSLKVVNLKYSKEETRQLQRVKYQEEIDFIARHESRNLFLLELCNRLPGNTLLITQFVEKHGNVLWDLFQKRLKKPKVPYYVHGGVDAEDREHIRKLVSHKTQSTIIATYQTYQVGINIPELNNIIFGTPSKSQIRILQSIGRGLRVSDTKNHVNIFDIVDDFRSGKYVNYACKHFQHRVPFYMAEKFPLSFNTVNISNFRI